MLSDSPFLFKKWCLMAKALTLGENRMKSVLGMEVDKYSERSAWGKFRYRIFRSAWVQFLIAPAIYLSILMRYPQLDSNNWEKNRRPFILNNLLIGTAYLGLASILGWKNLLLLAGPLWLMVGLMAFWLFYVQHQHCENYQENRAEWNHVEASILGATYYNLPKVFRWLSGNIGFHHIHNLNSRIPN